MGKFKGILNTVGQKVNDNSPELLIGIGLAGMFASTVMAVKVTPKVHSLIEIEREIREAEGEPDLTKMDIIKIGVKPYLPAVIGYCVSAACIIGANSVNSKRNAILLSAYKLGEKTLTEYKDAVIEVIGEEKEKEVKDIVSRKRMSEDPVSTAEVIFTGKGESLCYDTISGRYFQCDVDKIKKSVNDINYILLQDMYASLNDFYELIGIDAVSIGSSMGWNIDDGQMNIYFSAQIADNDQPCIVLQYDQPPKQGFDKIR